MQGTIFFACVAREGKQLVAASRGAVSATVLEHVDAIVRKVDASVASKRTYTAAGVVYNCVTEHNTTYVCVADEAMPRRVCFALLEHVRAEYVARGTPGRAFLKGEMEFFATNPDADKLRRVQAQVDDVKELMLSNLDSLLTRGERLEDIDRRTDDLAHVSNNFARQSRKVRSASACAAVAYSLIARAAQVRAVAAKHGADDAHRSDCAVYAACTWRCDLPDCSQDTELNKLFMWQN